MQPLNHEQKQPQGLAKVLSEFSNETSAHGIPRIAAAQRWYGKIMWTVILIIFITLFCQQIVVMFAKYRRNETTVTIQLVVEAPEFPAVTVCNLNPFKFQPMLLNASADVDILFAAYKAAVQRAQQRQVQIPPSRNLDAAVRKKRLVGPPIFPGQFPWSVNGSPGQRYFPVKVTCLCGEFICLPLRPTEIWTYGSCICQLDSLEYSISNCFSEINWTHQSCTDCVNGSCKALQNQEYRDYEYTNGDLFDNCICAPDEILPCLKEFGDGIPSISDLDPLPKNLRDEPPYSQFMNASELLSLNVVAREDFLYKISNLSLDRKGDLSYSKQDLLKMCSFNGLSCDIERDFTLHFDSQFGNCFTFSAFNFSEKSVRPGPMYGLRVLLLVNTTSYLPTTESTGVRVVIHQQGTIPFPDTFGFNGPTGLSSSFGVKLKMLNRLSKPVGHCTLSAENGKATLFPGFRYSVEACYRTCLQEAILTACNCSDPHYPQINGTTACSILESRCANTAMASKSTLTESCFCSMPCNENRYDVSYSAANWPSSTLQVFECDRSKMTEDECVLFYRLQKSMHAFWCEFCRFRKNAAVIEVFFEELNYEVLTESEVYGWANLVADFGGQLGLWMGFSIITWVEFGILMVNLLTIWFRGSGVSSNTIAVKPAD